MIWGIAKWHVFIANEAFLVATWGQSTTYPHDTGKNVSWMGVDDPHKTAGHLQNTPGHASR